MDSNQRTLKLFSDNYDVTVYRHMVCGYNLQPVKENFADRFQAQFEIKSDANATEANSDLDENMLVVGKFETSTCEELVGKYPNVEDLTIHCEEISIQALATLLSTKWATNLKSFHFYPMEFEWDTIWPHLAQMPQLAKLFLISVVGVVDLSVVPSLESLGLFDYEEGDLFGSLMKCGPNLKRLVLSHHTRTLALDEAMQGSVLAEDRREVANAFLNDDYSEIKNPMLLIKVDYTASVLMRLVEAKPQLKSSLTHLALNCDSYGEKYTSLGLIRFVCEQFHELRHLTLVLKEDVQLVNLLPLLGLLPHLTELGLTNIDLTDLQQAKVTLYSVRYFNIFTNFGLANLSALPAVFPNLVQFEFDMSIIECLISKKNYPVLEHVSKYCNECRLQLVGILSDFPLLPNIEFTSLEVAECDSEYVDSDCARDDEEEQ